jgi:hypothetical protein
MDIGALSMTSDFEMRIADLGEVKQDESEIVKGPGFAPSTGSGLRYGRQDRAADLQLLSH